GLQQLDTGMGADVTRTSGHQHVLERSSHGRLSKRIMSAVSVGIDVRAVGGTAATRPSLPELFSAVATIRPPGSARGSVQAGGKSSQARGREFTGFRN